MEAIEFKPTDYLPRISFKSNGLLLLEGRSLPENVNKLFEPMMKYARNISTHKIVFDINLEYFNTATSKKLLGLLQTFDLNSSIDYIVINWHYEEDDEDSLDIAKIYAECMKRSQLNYIAHPSKVELYKVKYHKSDYR